MAERLRWMQKLDRYYSLVRGPAEVGAVMHVPGSRWVLHYYVPVDDFDLLARLTSLGSAAEAMDVLESMALSEEAAGS